MSENTFLWHDYETFGTDPRRDQAVQFAGIRTDYDFNPVDEPFTLYCQPSADSLPQPDACIVTGITPQYAQQHGVCEAEFIAQIQQQLSRPNTCTLGYNNIRFDDEVTRNILYRNFYDPYAREWQNGNSRWDLIDVVRAAYGLRPEGIEWPLNEENKPVFKLEALTKANAIEHLSAHDALSDVYATIAIAKLIKQAQPRLFQFLFDHRLKAGANKLLQLGSFTPLVHVSGRYPAIKHCLAIILPLCPHPTNSNGVLVYDLSVDPTPMLALSVEEIKQRIFTATDDLADGVERIPIKTVHINKCPVLAPLSVIKKTDEQRLQLDLSVCLANAETIKAAWQPIQSDKIQQVFSTSFEDHYTDPDIMIYSGGFFSARDKAEMEKLRNTEVGQLATQKFNFSDARLPDMLFRYRARNYPETLTAIEQQTWRKFCQTKLTEPSSSSSIVLGDYLKRIQELAETDADKAILTALEDYADSKIKQYGLDRLHK